MCSKTHFPNDEIFDSPSSSKEARKKSQDLRSTFLAISYPRNFNIVGAARVVSALWKRNADLRVLEVAPRRKKEVRNTGV